MTNVGGVLAVWTSGDISGEVEGYSALTTLVDVPVRMATAGSDAGWSGNPQTNTSTATTKFII